MGLLLTNGNKEVNIGYIGFGNMKEGDLSNVKD